MARILLHDIGKKRKEGTFSYIGLGTHKALCLATKDNMTSIVPNLSLVNLLSALFSSFAASQDCSLPVAEAERT